MLSCVPFDINFPQKPLTTISSKRAGELDRVKPMTYQIDTCRFLANISVTVKAVKFLPVKAQINTKPVMCSCCGAGTAADTMMTTQMISSQIELHRLHTGRTPRVCTANMMLKQRLFR